MGKWTAQSDQILLVLILDTYNIKIDPEKIISIWPQKNTKPTDRAILERVQKLRMLNVWKSDGGQGPCRPDKIVQSCSNSSVSSPVDPKTLSIPVKGVGPMRGKTTQRAPKTRKDMLTKNTNIDTEYEETAAQLPIDISSDAADGEEHNARKRRKTTTETKLSRGVDKSTVQQHPEPKKTVSWRSNHINKERERIAPPISKSKPDGEIDFNDSLDFSEFGKPPQNGRIRERGKIVSSVQKPNTNAEKGFMESMDASEFEKNFFTWPNQGNSFVDVSGLSEAFDANFSFAQPRYQFGYYPQPQGLTQFADFWNATNQPIIQRIGPYGSCAGYSSPSQVAHSPLSERLCSNMGTTTTVAPENLSRAEDIRSKEAPKAEHGNALGNDYDMCEFLAE